MVVGIKVGQGVDASPEDYNVADGIRYYTDFIGNRIGTGANGLEDVASQRLFPCFFRLFFWELAQFYQLLENPLDVSPPVAIARYVLQLRDQQSGDR